MHPYSRTPSTISRGHVLPGMRGPRLSWPALVMVQGVPAGTSDIRDNSRWRRGGGGTGHRLGAGLRSMGRPSLQQGARRVLASSRLGLRQIHQGMQLAPGHRPTAGRQAGSNP